MREKAKLIHDKIATSRVISCRLESYRYHSPAYLEPLRYAQAPLPCRTSLHCIIFKPPNISGERNIPVKIAFVFLPIAQCKDAKPMSISVTDIA